MTGRRFAPGGLGDQRHDPPVAVLDRRHLAHGDLRVRLVDEPHVRDAQHGAHDVGADGVDRRVVVVLRVALPGGRVEDRTALARLDHGRRAQVELGAADPHQTAGVELQQAGDVPLHRGLTGHEDAVVGLGVVARHALLVALAVVDVDVQLAAIEQRLEVEHRVVAVEDDLGVGLVVELGQLGEGRGHRDRQVGALSEHLDGALVPRDDAHRMVLVELLQHGQPLDQLVAASGVVGEVGDDIGADHWRMLRRGCFIHANGYEVDQEVAASTSGRTSVAPAARTAREPRVRVQPVTTRSSTSSTRCPSSPSAWRA